MRVVLQKATRRGLSVRKSKKNREYTSLKSIGIKSVDETFKVSAEHVTDHMVCVCVRVCV